MDEGYRSGGRFASQSSSNTRTTPLLVQTKYYFRGVLEHTLAAMNDEGKPTRLEMKRGLGFRDESALIVQAWNTVLFEKFVRFRHLVTTGLAAHSDAFFERRPFLQGARVLDVGCGFGDTTLQIAELVGATGSAVGIDCAERFLEVARRDAGARRNVSFRLANAQTADLKGPYDHVFSRFGTMFFSAPGTALENLRRCLTDQGQFASIVWRRREDNDWLFAAEQCVKQRVPSVSHSDTEEAHCGPGPFSMADADGLSQLLVDAGFRQVTFERLDHSICIGRDLSEAVDFALTLGPAGEILRLAGDAAADKQAEVRAALTETLGRFERSHGVWAPSSAWLVLARAR